MIDILRKNKGVIIFYIVLAIGKFKRNKGSVNLYKQIKYISRF